MKKDVALYIGAIVAVIVSITGLNWWQSRNLSHVDFGAVVVTHRQLQTVRQLQDSLGEQSDASRYVRLLASLEADCYTVSAYASAAPGQLGSDRDTTVYLKKSAALCDDLTHVSADSRRLYEALLPVLQIDPQVKRYQTLPGIQSLVRHSDGNTIKAVQPLATQALLGFTFETHAKDELAQLQSDFDHSNGLSYYPALSNFQLRLLDERQRYWTTYGDISQLEIALRKLLGRFCTDLTPGDARTLATVCTEAN